MWSHEPAKIYLNFNKFNQGLYNNEIRVTLNTHLLAGRGVYKTLGQPQKLWMNRSGLKY